MKKQGLEQVHVTRKNPTLFLGALLIGPIFASGKVPIPKTTESIIDNCQLSEKQHRLEPEYAIEPGAHRQLSGLFFILIIIILYKLFA